MVNYMDGKLVIHKGSFILEPLPDFDSRLGFCIDVGSWACIEWPYPYDKPPMDWPIIPVQLEIPDVGDYMADMEVSPNRDSHALLILA
jgi:hypothetical protein